METTEAAAGQCEEGSWLFFLHVNTVVCKSASLMFQMLSHLDMPACSKNLCIPKSKIQFFKVFYIFLHFSFGSKFIHDLFVYF